MRWLIINISLRLGPDEVVYNYQDDGMTKWSRKSRSVLLENMGFAESQILKNFLHYG